MGLGSRYRNCGLRIKSLQRESCLMSIQGLGFRTDIYGVARASGFIVRGSYKPCKPSVSEQELSGRRLTA